MKIENALRAQMHNTLDVHLSADSTQYKNT